MTEQKRNSFEDEDLRLVIEEVEELEAEKVSIRAKAAGECGGISKQIGNAKGRAKDLGIPLAILNSLLKTRRLERQIAAVADGVPDDLTEMWVDAAGQFSFLAPEEGEEETETMVETAAKRRKKKADENQAAEQEAGAAVLDELVH